MLQALVNITCQVQRNITMSTEPALYRAQRRLCARKLRDSTYVHKYINTCIMRSFCTCRHILLGWSNQGLWNGQGHVEHMGADIKCAQTGMHSQLFTYFKHDMGANNCVVVLLNLENTGVGRVWYYRIDNVAVIYTFLSVLIIPH
jgi:hypothetical protein